MRCPTIAQLPAPTTGRRGWPWTKESAQLPDTMPDGSSWPKISIVTPSYNQGRFIEETIRSVLLQGYPNLEYIIIDGGSTDNSVEIIKKYDSWLTYWVSEPDRGQSNAINRGFEKASGEIYNWLNSDDYLMGGALKSIAMAYHVSPEAGAWCGGCVRVDADGNTVWTRWPKRLDVEGLAIWNENSFGQPACFFAERAWQKCGPLEEDLYYGMDFDLWLKLAEEFVIKKVDELLAAEHAHEDAKTQRDIGQMYAIQCLLQIRHGYERFAVQDITRWMNEYLELKHKENRIYRISRFPFLRPFAPIARIIWRKLR